MANRNQVPNAVLPLPPLEYDPQWANNLVRILNFTIQQLQNPGHIRGVDIVLTNLPTSATDLPPGSVWNDAGTLKIVP